MFGRLSFVQGDAARIDDLITYVREVVKPATDELDGNHGLGMWVGRDTGGALVMTVWRDAAALTASEQAVVKLRDDAAGIVGGKSVVERHELGLREVTIPHQPGFGMRLVQIQSSPATLDDDVAWAAANVVPAARSQDGFVSYILGIDRSAGTGIAMTTYRDLASMRAANAAAAKIRDMAIQRGVSVRGLHEYEVAIVGIRVPIPAQRNVDLTAAEERAKR